MKIISLLLILLSMLACAVSAPSATNARALPPLGTATTPTNTPHPVTQVTADNLNIRAHPNHTAQIVGYLIRGESVTVLECHGVWARVGVDRWVNSYYLERTCK